MIGRIHRFVIIGLAALAAIAVLFLLRKPPKRPAAPPRPHVSVPARKPAAGRIAIVIDDLGNTAQNFGIFAQIQQPLTVSVIPNLPYSAQAAETLHKKFEVLLHLPMEPKNGTGLEPDTILAGMDAGAVRRIIGGDLESIRYAKGVNNHMGSKATEDAAVWKPTCLHRSSLRGRCDRRKDGGRLREGRRYVECYDQHVRREKDVSPQSLWHITIGRRLPSAPLFFFTQPHRGRMRREVRTKGPDLSACTT
jgi:hypothetical protein